MKVVRTAVLVVGAVALAAVTAGVGAAAIAGTGLAAGATAGIGTLAVAASAIGISSATLGAVFTAAAIGTGLSLAAGLLPKPSSGGSQTKWKADPYAGLPYVMGRTLTSGNIIYKRGWGSKNKFETFVTILSIGTIMSVDTTFANKTTVAFSGGDATGTYHDRIYQSQQLGARPESAALTTPMGYPDGWTSAHKLSGLAAIMTTFQYDGKGSTTFVTEPQMAWIMHGVYVYDPRQDSTYPGGSGSCRALDESTYVWSEDPHLHALTYALGRWQNGKRVAGIGALVAEIDMAPFVEGANLNDARGWKVGGQVVTRPDTHWNNMKAILQAGGAAPVLLGGRISCINRAPRVSLATIGRGDIVGECSLAGTQPRRERLNGIIPQYRSEAHDWELVSATGVIVSSYVALDGDERTEERSYPLVQDVSQVAQLATYDICDAREAGPGTFPLKPWWLNYRVGDCVTVAPEDGFSLKAIITGRDIDPQSGIVTYTLKGETDAKHAFALGQTGVAPPTGSITYSSVVAAPASGSWTATGVALSSSGGSVPAISISGASDDPNATDIIFEYREHGATDWIAAAVSGPAAVGLTITGVKPGGSYDVAVSYRVRGTVGAQLVLGPVTAGALATATAAHTIRTRSVAYPVTSDDTSITIATFGAVLDDGDSLTLPSGSITGLAHSATYGLFYNPGTSAYSAPAEPAATSMADAALVFLQWVTTSDGTGTGTFPTPPTAPGGYGGTGSHKNAY